MADWSGMTSLRERLDKVDEDIIRLFGERYAIRREVYAYKKEQGLPIVDPARVTEVIERAVSKAAQYDVPQDFAKALYTLVIDYSHKFEEEEK